MTKAENNELGPRDVKLEDGRVLVVKLNGMTWRDIREYVAGVPSFDPNKPDASTEAERRHAELKGRTCGLSADEVLALGFEDFTRLSRKITDLITDPVDADPN